MVNRGGGKILEEKWGGTGKDVLGKMVVIKRGLEERKIKRYEGERTNSDKNERDAE